MNKRVTECLIDRSQYRVTLTYSSNIQFMWLPEAINFKTLESYFITEL